jgi:hypothetical protein
MATLNNDSNTFGEEICMVNSKHSIKRGTQALGAISFLAVMAACGGGGGGGTSTSSAGASSSSSSGGEPSLGGLACVAGVGANTGFTIGVCDGTAGTPPINAIKSQFQNFEIKVTVDSFSGKRYSISTATPLSPESKSFDASQETCSGNVVGVESAFLMEFFTIPTAQATSPRTALLSFTQSYGSLPITQNGSVTNPCATASNKQNPTGFATTYMDVVTWERYLGQTSLYYGGWYAPKTTTNSPAAVGKQYLPGKLYGYRLNAEGSWGLSGEVVNASYDASGVKLLMQNFKYSRSLGGKQIVNPNPGAVLPPLQLVSDKIVGSVVSGTVSGGPGFGGIFEGSFGGPNGEEFAGRFQVTMSAAGDIVAGAFAVKSQ